MGILKYRYKRSFFLSKISFIFDLSKQIDMKKKKTIAEKIKEKGIKKGHVAKMVGINSATLSRILKGSQDYVSVDILAKIHSYLDALNTNNVDN